MIAKIGGEKDVKIARRIGSAREHKIDIRIFKLLYFNDEDVLINCKENSRKYIAWLMGSSVDFVHPPQNLSHYIFLENSRDLLSGPFRGASQMDFALSEYMYHASAFSRFI
jgi:hypothetical protein